MKNLNDLQKLQNVKAPAELKEKTLAAARELRREEREAEPQHLAPAPRRAHPWVRRSLAAVCALAVVFGGAKLLTPKGQEPLSPVEAFANTFGLVAYAADTGETMEAKDSRIVFDSGSGFAQPKEDGNFQFYSGCLFRVTGENIKSVSASMDKGSLYREKVISLPSESVRAAAARGEAPEVQGAAMVQQYTMAEDPDDPNAEWFAEAFWELENGFEETYDPDAAYGFRAALTEEEMNSSEDLQQSWHHSVDYFDGAQLSVTVTFTDGTTQTQKLHLKTGKLAVEYVEGKEGPQLTGELAADPDKPYVYGVYAEIV